MQPYCRKNSSDDQLQSIYINTLPRPEWQTMINKSAWAAETQHSSGCQFRLEWQTMINQSVWPSTLLAASFIWRFGIISAKEYYFNMSPGLEWQTMINQSVWPSTLLAASFIWQFGIISAKEYYFNMSPRLEWQTTINQSVWPSTLLAASFSFGSLASFQLKSIILTCRQDLSDRPR